jgi:hypothetical protein
MARGAILLIGFFSAYGLRSRIDTFLACGQCDRDNEKRNCDMKLAGWHN